MSQTPVVLPGTGEPVATDLFDANGHYQLIKVCFGSIGAVTIVDASNPLPVTDAGLTAGSARAKITDGTSNAAVKAASAASGATDPSLVVQLSPNNTIGLALDATLTGGSQKSKITDGTNEASVKAASTAAVATDKAVVVAISPNNTVGVSGTITANIGTSGSLALDATLTGGTQRAKITDGTSNVAVKAASTASAATDPAMVVALSPNNTIGLALDATLTGGAQQTKITDGTNVASVKAASTAAVATDKAVVVAISPNNTIPVSGTITANIGTSGSLALDATLTGGTQRAKITDGTNNAAVKAASTAAVATDPAMVVAVSPNNTVTVAGTITANIGTSGSLALDATLTGGSQQAKITDGTNVASVKAASTAAGATDKAVVVAISPNNTVAATQSGGWSFSGTVAHDSVDSGNPLKIGAKALNAWTTAVSNLDRADGVSDLLGRLLVASKPNELQKSFSKRYTTTQTGDALWTPGGGKRIVVTSLTISSSSTTAGEVTVWFGASADTTYTAGTDQCLEDVFLLPTATANPGITEKYCDPVVCLNADYILRVTTSAGMTVNVTVHGYEIP